MASTFKTFVSDDIANTRTLLHEAIPITGSIVNGTTYATHNNIKTYGHGMFQSVYDYPYESSSANHIFDITYGHHEDISTQWSLDDGLSTDQVSNSLPAGATGDLSGIENNDMFAKRKNIYNQMAQVLVGHDVNGSIRKFDIDMDLTGGNKYNSLIFINFARLLGKDEIKKGSFSITFGATQAIGSASDNANTIVIDDSHAATDYRVNSPAGEVAVLKATGGNRLTGSRSDYSCGFIFYQAGIIAITPEIFNDYNSSTHPQGFGLQDLEMAANQAINDVLRDEDNDAVALSVRKRIINLEFSNTTELNSTIYFCRVGHNDFNYSSNPTYLEDSKIRVKNKTTDAPVSYITTVGLYSADNEMLAVAKLSEPLRKDPTNDITLRVRLDY